MKEPLLNYIESLVNEILSSPNYDKLSQPDKKKIAQSLREHFQDIVLETFMDRLTDEEVKEARKIIKEPKKLEQKFEHYAASTPGLATDIESRLLRESEALKSLA